MDDEEEQEQEQEQEHEDVIETPDTSEVDVLRANINSLKALNDELTSSNVKLQGANDALMETNRELMDRLGLPPVDKTDDETVTLDKILEGIE